jgi:hypothetical protein
MVFQGGSKHRAAEHIRREKGRTADTDIAVYDKL